MQSQASETSLTPIPGFGEQNPSFTLYHLSLGVPRAHVTELQTLGVLGNSHASGWEVRAREKDDPSVLWSHQAVSSCVHGQQGTASWGALGSSHSQSQFGVVKKLVVRLPPWAAPEVKRNVCGRGEGRTVAENKPKERASHGKKFPCFQVSRLGTWKAGPNSVSPEMEPGTPARTGPLPAGSARILPRTRHPG